MKLFINTALLFMFFMLAITSISYWTSGGVLNMLKIAVRAVFATALTVGAVLLLVNFF